MNKFQLIVESEFSSYRLDDYLLKKNASASRTGIRKAARNNLLLVNGIPVRPGYKVMAGETVLVTFKPENEFIAENLNLEIVYEDPHLIVINKPAGMVIHPSVSHHSGTLLNGLLYHLQNRGQMKPLLIHRLDKDTSGLIVFAKDNVTQRSLSKQFKNHTAQRTYLALAWGNPAEEDFTISAKISETSRKSKEMKVDEKGKEAVTHLRVIRRFGFSTLLSCRLETGRTHQVRVHLKYAGHPLFNDPVYTPADNNFDEKTDKVLKEAALLLPGQALHAYQLEFFHPVLNTVMKFTADLPAGFKKILDLLPK